MSSHLDPAGGGTTTPAETSRVSWPLIVSLVLIAGVWVAGAVWSYDHQSRFAESLGFHHGYLLPAVADGLPVAMAAVAFSAALDGRPATVARLGTALAVAASSASNGIYAWRRSGHDLTTVIVAVAIPVMAAVAFEVLLGEIRKQVLQRRGATPPAPIPLLRPIRVLLDPAHEIGQWRRTVLAVTDPAVDPAAREAMVRLVAQIRAEQAVASLGASPGVSEALPGSGRDALPISGPEARPVPLPADGGEQFEAPRPDAVVRPEDVTPTSPRPVRRRVAAATTGRAGGTRGRRADDTPADPQALIEAAARADAQAQAETGRPLSYRAAPGVLGVRYATAREALDAARQRAALPAADAPEAAAAPSVPPQTTPETAPATGEGAAATPAAVAGELTGARS